MIDAELLSVLRHLVLANRLPERHALQARATSQRSGQRRHASRHLWLRAWALRANLTAEHALDVALAEQLGATLLTADARAAWAPGLYGGVELLPP